MRSQCLYYLGVASGGLCRYWETLAFRLAAGYALAGLAFIFLATASLYLVLLMQLEKSTNMFIGDKLNVVRALLRDRPTDWNALREEIELETSARRYQRFYIRLLDQQQTLLLATPGMAEQLNVAQLAKQALSHPKSAFEMVGKDGKAFLVATAIAPVGRAAESNDVIQIAVDVSQEKDLLAGYRRWFWTIFAAACAFLPFIGYRIARQGIRPVEEMASTARRISSSNLRERLRPEGYPFELASLAATFNKMLDGLEESFERISRFSADIAHDLRTPVNNIRGEAEVALARARTVEEYRDVLGSCLEEAVRLSNLIGDLLFLARAESPLPLLHRERTDVAHLLTRVREYYEASAADAGVLLTTTCAGEPVIAAVDQSLIQRALSNLVSNAVAHTPSGGSIVMTAKTNVSNLHIEVSDTGIGIPADALPRVFDRFFRVDASRSQMFGGTGLGLAIVQTIALLHGGNVQIASKRGEGTRVTLSLPVSLPNMTES
ncbi:MAG: heavy metal sensor histidine kinase [Acidobacteriaceae bacterium]|nr:heavy metal sensor histidine kinase [Acidobacteriaceae bacterium]